MRSGPYVFEMQLFLHPKLKDQDILGQVVQTCNSNEPPASRDTNVNRVKGLVNQKVRDLMILVAQSNGSASEVPLASTDTTATEESNTLSAIEALQSEIPVPQQPIRSAFDQDLNDFFAFEDPNVEAIQRGIEVCRITEEIDRWISSPIAMIRGSDNQIESILDFWRRQYAILPKVARIIYAVSVSSAEIERDFGVSGMMVTSQRASMADHNVDMRLFLNRNREYIDITQCDKLDTEEASRHVPSNVAVQMQQQNDDDLNVDELLSSYFSNNSDDLDF